MMTKSQLKLDHVILLLPYDMLSNPPSWLTEHFTISPGGRHADNKTENRLVMFQDGTYLELIAFINDDPDKRKGHWWDKPYGVVDYAFTTTDLDYEGIVNRLDSTGTGISYDKPKGGGRTKPDGTEIKWEITFPNGVDRGNVPFFCTDVTPRERRVPITKENTTHPSGAIGMAGMSLEIEKSRLGNISKATSAILDEKETKGVGFEVDIPKRSDAHSDASVLLKEAAAGSERPLALTLRLQLEGTESREAIRQPIGDGIVSITFESGK